MRHKFEVIVETWTDPSIPIFVPYTSLEEAIECEGNEAVIYDKNGKLIYNGLAGKVNSNENA